MERNPVQPRPNIRAQDLVESAVLQPTIESLALAKYAFGLCLNLTLPPDMWRVGEKESPPSARARLARSQSLNFLREACEGLHSNAQFESLGARLVRAVRASGLQETPPDQWPQSLRDRVAAQPDRFALLLYASGFLHQSIDFDQISPPIAHLGSFDPVLLGALCNVGHDCSDSSLLYHELCGIFHSCDGSTAEERLQALAAHYGTDRATFSSQASQIAEIIRTGRYRFLSKR
jgi:hypothetical protein